MIIICQLRPIFPVAKFFLRHIYLTRWRKTDYVLRRGNAIEGVYLKESRNLMVPIIARMT